MPSSDALRDICGRLDSGDIDYVQFLELFTRELAREMGCSFAGIWIFVGGDGGRLLHNIAMYDAAQDRMVAAAPIEGPAVAAYFDALLRDEVDESVLGRVAALGWTAAAIARAASARVRSGTCAMISPRAGLLTAKVAPSAASIHSPAT